MGSWVADELHQRRAAGRDAKPGRALILGLTFKEDVPDLRNSRAFDLVGRLGELGYRVDVADPLADPDELMRDHGLAAIKPNGTEYDLVIGAVAHAEYRQLSASELEKLLAEDGLLADLKGMWRKIDLDPTIRRWSL
jgi:UDP-N-acetyl-D-galactosamine dehydrogenase